jgi:hypothetical protein
MSQSEGVAFILLRSILPTDSVATDDVVDDSGVINPIEELNPQEPFPSVGIRFL